MIDPTPQKEIARTFLTDVAGGRVSQAFAGHISPSFKHHNLYFAGDAETLAKGMAESARNFPDKVFDIQRMIEDGDLLAVHSRLRMAPNSPDITVVHILRFEGDKIIEMWDIGVVVPEDNPNRNGAF